MTKVLTNVVGEVTVTEQSGSIKESKETLGLTVYEGPTTEIGCELGYTMNLGNFQSARLGVSIKAPSNLDEKSLDKTFTYLSKWCDAKLAKMIEDVKQDVS